ncbi:MULTISPECIES: aldo/keto reductase [unclassified Paenibacillus]|uniref:aldo/keto reductase n=1 Tax=unclassified Paenibacillus TaxID=185978 RepID=UPI001AE48869|nr:MULTISPECIES: aldo/keto reductase [unclassified Paenibacillus]MBP1157629.1 diketogulonate reductase-like aldo/keto reductase [Paenibacillus sp. PvP091]MBP1171634.1 diketogulonate reductase-like aldo/keto reductase [Paenibacillus sp. PvR098]MBP2438015.1 diketogulonate reductase-like aldo/keto reductase [Paenibacillus sp. PvP052]
MSKHNSEQIQYINNANAEHQVQLSDGTLLPRLGQGTWYIGDEPSKRKEEIQTLRLGVELGMHLIDTAEMYGDGRAESLVGEAIEGIRDDVFLVSKVYPHNAGLGRIAKSCEDSLKRLKTDRLDLYLLHWRGIVPLSETIEGMERLVEAGKILRWGVSNLDTDDMKELFRLDKGAHCVTNQVLYHLGSRGIEYDLLPWQREFRMPIMAYCPMAQAGSLRKGLIGNPVVKDISERRGITPFQLLLAWCIRNGDVIAIPKASTEDHVLENAAAGCIEWTEEELRRLDEVFPKPSRKVPLDIV